MLVTAEHPEWILHHVDICNADCTAELGKPIHMHMPRCMLEQDLTLKNKKARVVRALCRHQCSPRALNKHLHEKVQSYGFAVSPVDPCLYSRRDDQGMSFLLAYLDKICYVGCEAYRKEFVHSVNIETNPTNGFKIRNHGVPTLFLGIEITRDVADKTISRAHKD